MALLAVAAAVCLGASGGGVIGVSGVPGSTGTNPYGDHRRVGAETDQAVASFMACLNEAAKTLAGPALAVVERDAETFTLPATPHLQPLTTDDFPVVAVQPHVSLLNLPPPATLS